MADEIGELDLTAQASAAKTATNYITVDSSGIKIHNTNDNSNYQHLTSDGTEIYKSGNSVAAFGNTARIGKSDSLHMNLSNGGIRLYEKEETPYTDASVAKFTIDESVIGYTTDIHTSISSGGFQLLNGESKLFTIDTEPIWVSHTCHNDDYEVKSFTFDEIFGEGTITTNDAIIDFSSGDNIHASGAGDGWFFIESSILRAKPQIYFNLTDQTLDLARPWIPIDDEDIADYFKYEYLEPEHYQQDTYRFWFRVQWTPISNFLPLEWKIGFGHYNYDITTQIGKNNESHMELDYHSMQLIDKEGGTYFYVSDLRGSDGTLSITDRWTSSGSQYTTFMLRYEATDTNYTVSVADGNGNDVTNQFTMSDKDVAYFSLSPDPPSGYAITAEYDTASQKTKAYTAGIRANGNGDDIGPMSFAEGYDNTASGDSSHAEGWSNTASGDNSHAEGMSTTASGYCSHAEGGGTTASDYASHAEGNHTTASGTGSHAEGVSTTASRTGSHAQNYQTTAAYDYQTAIGMYNDNQSDNAFEIGNGTSDSSRSNAFAVDWNGNVEAKGHYYAEGERIGNSWCYINSITDTSITAKATDKKVPVTSLDNVKPSGAFEYVSSSKSVKCNVAGWYMVSIQAGFDDTATMSDDLVGIGVARVHNGTTANVAGPDYVRVRTNRDRALLMPTPVYFYEGDTFYPVVRNNSNARGVLHTMRFMVAPLIG